MSDYPEWTFEQMASDVMAATSLDLSFAISRKYQQQVLEWHKRRPLWFWQEGNLISNAWRGLS